MKALLKSLGYLIGYAALCAIATPAFLVCFVVTFVLIIPGCAGFNYANEVSERLSNAKTINE